MQHFALIITHIIALILYYFHPRVWVKWDTARITADGAAQSLTQRFHTSRLLWRAGFVAAVALVASLPCRDISHTMISAAGLACIGGAYFWFDFTPRLNLARHLAYVSEYHVSWAVGASRFDRTLWRKAWQRVRLPSEAAPPDFPRPDVVAEAGLLLRRVLRWGLVAGVVGYLLSLFLLFIL